LLTAPTSVAVNPAPRIRNVVDRLPEPFRTASHYNPFFYLIDGFRYGFIGQADGDIRFVLEGQAPTVFPVSNGAYAGKANAGKNRVEVRAYRKAAPSPTALATDDPNARVNYLPDRYNSQTTLQAEVKPGAANDYPFTVTSR